MKFKIKGQEERNIVEFDLELYEEMVMFRANGEKFMSVDIYGNVYFWPSDGTSRKEFKINLDYYAKGWIG